ncbi:MAG: cell division protein FtsL [Eggerthellaceae bacterium]|nr:cell division protein FtsL [Eggerthellaceae bacterium]
MASAQPAYRFGAYPDFAPERYDAPDVRVVRGRKTRAEQPSTAPSLITLVKMAAILLVVVAVLACARITLTSASVTTMIESNAISANIAEARTMGTNLEVAQSAYTSPQNLAAAAKRLGMAAPFEVETIALEKDVVAVNADGDLSISDTIKNVAGTQA